MERALAAKLGELFADIAWLRPGRVEQTSASSDAGFDLLATLPLAEGKAALCVVCKDELRASAFESLAARKLSPGKRVRYIVPVLAMPFVPDRVAELCVKRGWGWYDLAGNCYIDVPGAIHVERSGHAPVFSPPRPLANLGTSEAGRVIRALLATENVSRRWTQRSMETHFGEPPVRSGNTAAPIPEPSLGLVNKVVRYLRDEAFIDASPGGGFRLRDPVKLLLAWRDTYRFDRHERRRYFTLLQGRKLQDAFYRLGLYAGGFAAYASFSAAGFQAPHVRQPKTWLYVGAEHVTRLEELVGARQAESGENLVVSIPDDAGVFYLADGGSMGEPRLACTNPVQTYVDLWYSGGRGQEAAEALLEQRLKPAWAVHDLAGDGSL
jgi:hypothetical protein